jgi:hypothetical protein
MELVITVSRTQEESLVKYCARLRSSHWNILGPNLLNDELAQLLLRT